MKSRVIGLVFVQVQGSCSSVASGVKASRLGLGALLEGCYSSEGLLGGFVSRNCGRVFFCSFFVKRPMSWCFVLSLPTVSMSCITKECD